MIYTPDEKRETIYLITPTRARNLPYYTYIGRDAIEALRDYLKVRQKSEHKAIILNDYGKPMNRNNVQTYWRRLLKRRGFVDPPKDPSNVGNRYAKSLHELRDVFRTQWQKAVPRPAPEVAEFMMGHGSGDINEYIKFYRDTQYIKQEYLKALPMFQIMSSGIPFGQVDRSELDALKKQVAEAKSGQNGKIAEVEAKNQRLKTQVETMMKNYIELNEKFEKLLKLQYKYAEKE